MGTKFRAFSSYVEIIPSVRWVVYDLPKIAEEGRRHAAQNGLSSLEFISDLSDAPNADILLASGLLQYVDQSLGDLLNCLPARSKYVLLNKVAVRDGERVVTLENFDFAVVPYHIRSRAELFADIDAAGYDILDQWTILSLNHAIPTHPNLGRSESLGFVCAQDSPTSGLHQIDAIVSSRKPAGNRIDDPPAGCEMNGFWSWQLRISNRQQFSGQTRIAPIQCQRSISLVRAHPRRDRASMPWPRSTGRPCAVANQVIGTCTNL